MLFETQSMPQIYVNSELFTFTVYRFKYTKLSIPSNMLSKDTDHTMVKVTDQDYEEVDFVDPESLTLAIPQSTSTNIGTDAHRQHHRYNGHVTT